MTRNWIWPITDRFGIDNSIVCSSISVHFSSNISRSIAAYSSFHHVMSPVLSRENIVFIIKFMYKFFHESLILSDFTVEFYSKKFILSDDENLIHRSMNFIIKTARNWWCHVLELKIDALIYRGSCVLSAKIGRTFDLWNLPCLH